MTDRELDALVAEKVMGWSFEAASPTSRDGDFWSDGENYVVAVDEFHPSTDVNAAWQVVEKMRGDGWILDLSYYHSYINAAFSVLGESRVGYAEIERPDESVARIICRAALAANRAEVPA